MEQSTSKQLETKPDTLCLAIQVQKVGYADISVSENNQNDDYSVKSYIALSSDDLRCLKCLIRKFWGFV